MSDKEKIAKYIQIINNCIEYLTEDGNDTDEILTIFDSTKEELDMLYISIE